MSIRLLGRRGRKYIGTRIVGSASFDQTNDGVQDNLGTKGWTMSGTASGLIRVHPYPRGYSHNRFRLTSLFSSSIVLNNV